MSTRLQLQLLFHGAVVLFIGQVCGLPYGMAISAGVPEETVRAWQLAHTGLSAGGVALVAVALHHLALGARARATLVWSLVGANYCFLAAILVSVFWGGRGLEPEGPLSNVLVFIGYSVFALATLLGSALLVVGARNALRAAPSAG